MASNGKPRPALQPAEWNEATFRELGEIVETARERTLRREKRAFRWACIWGGGVIVGVSSLAVVGYLEYRAVAAVAAAGGRPGSAHTGPVASFFAPVALLLPACLPGMIWSLAAWMSAVADRRRDWLIEPESKHIQP